MSLLCAAVAALGVGLGVAGAYRPAPAKTTAKTDRLDLLLTASLDSPRIDLRPSVQADARNEMRVLLASLETGGSSDASAEDAATPSAQSRSRILFTDRFVLGGRNEAVARDETAARNEPSASFEQRFAITGVAANADQGEAVEIDLRRKPQPPAVARPIDTPPPPRATKPEPVRSAAKQPTFKLASLTTGTIELPSKKPTDPPEGAKEPSFDTGKTAIYDISARMVYLPNGKRLEAHSGLAEHMDDPRAIHLKGKGPTPPNIYKLTLREHLFHGVRAIRLLPADETKMYGRDGILAHTYMLGPNGQSNGCVSFNDYPAFLNAYLNGEIDRIVVVEHLDNPPGGKDGGTWFADAIGGLFKRALGGGQSGGGQSEERSSALSFQ